MKERAVTTIIISHRSGVFDAVDRLMLLNAGAVAAYGSRDEVMKQANAGAQSRSTVRKLPFNEQAKK